MKEIVFYALAAAVSVVMLATAAPADPKEPQRIVGPDAVCKDSPRFLDKIRECAPLGTPKSGECLIETMRSAHARAAADFSTRIRGEGYIRNFRKVGPVDIAYVEYPFRANENNGILLVNGDPDLVDVDDLKALPKKDLANDPAYKSLLGKFPEAMLFAGDRFNTDTPTVEPLAGGGTIFIVPYRLTKCRACPLLAVVRFGFDFDAEGKFHGIRYLSLDPVRDASQTQDK